MQEEEMKGVQKEGVQKEGVRKEENGVIDLSME